MVKRKEMTQKNQKFSWIFDLAIEILILVVIFLIPTIFDRRLGIVFSGTKAAWMRTFGLGILSVWAIKIIVTGRHRFIRSALDWPVASFLLCTTVATLTSVHFYTSFMGFYGRYEGLTSWYLFGLFFFVITNFIKTGQQLRRIIVTTVSASTLMAIYSVLQRHSLDPYMWGGVVTWQRVIGTIGQPNFLAAYMLMAFFLVLAFFLIDKGDFSKPIDWSRQLLPLAYFFFAQLIFVVMIYTLGAGDFWVWYLAFFIVTLLALLFTFSSEQLHPLVLNVILSLNLLLVYICILYTQSRGGYMGLFTGGTLFALVSGRGIIFAHWRKIAVLGSLIILVSALTMLRPEFSPFERFTSEVTTIPDISVDDVGESKLELKGAAGSRGETWKSSFGLIANNPVFGVGPEVLKMVFPRYETDLFRFKEAFHVKQDRAHNETFDVTVTKGLTTFFVYLWLHLCFSRLVLIRLTFLNPMTN
ncbi:MAG: O-antigen ligase family protein [Candidatus Margulisbacteria bacterium]|nr:O-antigen ligase family protein [Candidatus Margulisiibacteriota bacterium]